MQLNTAKMNKNTSFNSFPQKKRKIEKPLEFKHLCIYKQFKWGTNPK